MSSYNRVILMGSCTRDPAIKYLPSKTAVAEWGLAMNRRYKTAAGEEKEEVVFVDCTAFAGTAEFVAKWFTKGKPMLCEGRLKHDVWEDKNGGGKRSKISVVAEHVMFAGGNKEGGGGRQRDDGDQGESAGGGAPDPYGFKEKDIPFAPNVL